MIFVLSAVSPSSEPSSQLVAPNLSKMVTRFLFTTRLGLMVISLAVFIVLLQGKLTNGKVFDSSFKRGEPIDFTLGTGKVIKGWDQGILGMCRGCELRMISTSRSYFFGPAKSALSPFHRIWGMVPQARVTRFLPTRRSFFERN